MLINQLRIIPWNLDTFVNVLLELLNVWHLKLHYKHCWRDMTGCCPFTSPSSSNVLPEGMLPEPQEGSTLHWGGRVLSQPRQTPHGRRGWRQEWRELPTGQLTWQQAWRLGAEQEQIQNWHFTRGLFPKPHPAFHQNYTIIVHIQVLWVCKIPLYLFI